MTRQQALSKSEKKWSDIHIGTGVDMGTANCSLCKLYLDQRELTCYGCPIYEKVGWHSCGNTPYGDFAGHMHSDHYQSGILKTVEDCKECARTSFAMWEFMYKLKLEESI